MSDTPVPAGELKLNLGCGSNKKPGYVNVDKFGSPDLRWDLEVFPWPWPDNSVSVVELFHVLEHLGRTPEQYMEVMQELYRVCRPEGVVRIAVPHWRHDYFADDPTHVRAVTLDGLRMLDQSWNKECEEKHYANSQLGRYYGVDFKVTKHQFKLTSEGEALRGVVGNLMRCLVNVCEEVQVEMLAVKPQRFPLTSA
jgi:SAM-dependent methyltransferase